MIRIEIDTIQTIEDEIQFNSLYEGLSDERKRAVDSYKKWDDRRRSLLAGVMLEKSVKEKLSASFPRIAYKENGKPYFPDYPICFNLSHSGDYVMCAIADEEIGCDIQALRPLRVDFVKKYYTDFEKEYLQRKQEDGQYPATADYEKDVLRIFSAKESYMKYTGLGFRLDFRNIEVDLEQGLIRSLGKCVKLIEIRIVPEGYVGMCCVAEVFNIDPEKKK